MKKQIKVSTQSFSVNRPKETREAISSYYVRNFKGKVITNAETGFKIELGKEGGKKTAWGGRVYLEKLAITSVLDQVIEQMTYNNWGDRKETDSPDVIGFMNFKASVFVDDVLKKLNIAVKLKKGGSFYYSFDVNVWK